MPGRTLGQEPFLASIHWPALSTFDGSAVDVMAPVAVMSLKHVAGFTLENFQIRRGTCFFGLAFRSWPASRSLIWTNPAVLALKHCPSVQVGSPIARSPNSGA